MPAPLGLIALRGQITCQIDLACDEIVPRLTRHFGTLAPFAQQIRRCDAYRDTSCSDAVIWPAGGEYPGHG